MAEGIGIIDAGVARSRPSARTIGTCENTAISATITTSGAHPVFDERFCRKAAARRANRVDATVDWTNLTIGLPPAPHLLRLLGAMSANRAVADEFTSNFNYPERQWDILATPERTNAFLARHGME